MIKLSLSGQTLRWKTAPVQIAADSVEQVAVEFVRGEDWREMLLTAQFTSGGKTYSVYLGEENRCFLPPQIVPGELSVSVFGVSGETKRSVTKPLITEVVKSGYVKDGETPLPPAPDLYNQIAERVSAAERLTAEHAEASEKSAVRAETAVLNPPEIRDGTWWIYDSENGYTDSGFTAMGEKGDKGDIGMSGADGKTPVKGVDYFTDDEINEFAMLIADEVMKSLGVIVDSINGEAV